MCSPIPGADAEGQKRTARILSRSCRSFLSMGGFRYQHGKMKSHCYRKTVLTSTISQRVVLSSQLKECQFRRFAGQCLLHFADPCSIRSPSQPYSPSDRVAARRNLSLARHTGFPFLLKSTPPQTNTSRAIGPLSTVNATCSIP